ncbi:hypothetical protein GOBAR_AA19955 [Gossypium barbadense]|uniref:DUF4220 domain-containing protein n=1 Tax=Gossypium barbadense TaxID=3634 RepID=A0A2P5XBK7_GOSBA|nr:hypothetical protein GOBAR_AA19955 [Gossypium barbadense]
MGNPLAGCTQPYSLAISGHLRAFSTKIRRNKITLCCNIRLQLIVLTTLLKGDNTLGNKLIVLWTPFLLWHLGSPHNITAYSLEDNDSWLRHFFGFVFQVAEAIYIYAKFKSISNFALNAMAIPIFFAGVIKYGERIWAIRCASDKQLFNSFFSIPDDRIYTKGKVVRTGLSKEMIDSFFKNEAMVPNVEFLHRAFLSYNIFKPLFTDLPFRLSKDFHDDRVYMIVASRLQCIKAKPGIRSMAQHDLVKYCVKAKTSRFTKAIRLFDNGNLLQKYGHTKWKPVNPGFKNFIYDHLQKKRDRCTKFDFKLDELELLNVKDDHVFKDKYKEMLGTDADLVESEFMSIIPKMDRTYFVRSIFLWHIATELAYYDYHDNHRVGAAGTDSLCNISKSLSSYMMYLTLVRPAMLCKGFTDVINRKIHPEARKFLFEEKERNFFKSQKNFTRDLLNFVTFEINLVSMNCHTTKLEHWWRELALREAWMEMMIHAASHCPWREHAQQLRHGGELLTHVALYHGTSWIKH